PTWETTLKPLPPDLLPVSITGASLLPAGTSLLPLASPISLPLASSAFKPEHFDGKLLQTLTVSSATLKPQPSFSHIEVIQGSETQPLIVQGQQGQGVVS